MKFLYLNAIRINGSNILKHYSIQLKEKEESFLLDILYTWCINKKPNQMISSKISFLLNSNHHWDAKIYLKLPQQKSSTANWNLFEVQTLNKTKRKFWKKTEENLPELVYHWVEIRLSEGLKLILINAL